MDWRRLNRGSVVGHQGRHLLIVRPNGTGYFGLLEYSERDFLVLSNFGTHQRIKFDSAEWHFKFIDLQPFRKIPKLADRRLPL